MFSVCTLISFMVLGLPRLTITLISSSAQITLNIGYYWTWSLHIGHIVGNLPIVLGVEHFERLLNVIIKLVISTLLLHQDDKLLEK